LTRERPTVPEDPTHAPELPTQSAGPPYRGVMGERARLVVAIVGCVVIGAIAFGLIGGAIGALIGGVVGGVSAILWAGYGNWH
jgi:hypothetical protein